jgi:SAM-dependent methyltransferase
VTAAARSWRAALAEWSIPAAILEQAPESPWIHPPVLFELPAAIASSPSHERAREALSGDASILDIGCGGGIATFAVASDLRSAVGVDHQQAMLAMYRDNGERFAIPVSTVFGDWPDVAAQTPVCDVAAAHHVVYNVGDIQPFLTAMAEHARHRVVLELPAQHPLASMTSAWQHFWQLERPTGPSPELLMDVIADLGFRPKIEHWNGPLRVEQDLDQAAHFMRIRLCLPIEREGEVRDFLATNPVATTRPLATIWWDL